MPKRVAILAVMIAMSVHLLSGQCSTSYSPNEVVNEIWSAATRGDLLTGEGWNKASRKFFTETSSPPDNKIVKVVSNDWGPPAGTTTAEKADVTVGYTDLGQIDAKLQYHSAKTTDAIKMGISYRLVFAPSFVLMYGTDGKTLIQKKPTGCKEWEIQGSLGAPWATVNTAIRYILEEREKTTDPAIRKNADQTLAKLLSLH